MEYLGAPIMTVPYLASMCECGHEKADHDTRSEERSCYTCGCIGYKFVGLKVLPAQENETR